MAGLFRDLTSAEYSVTLSAGFFSDREARAEYARLRKVANARLQRLEKAGYSESAVFRRYGEGFESLRGASAQEVRERLGDVAKFLGRKTSSVTGQRAAVRSFVETMHELGYDFINKGNADKFGRFMEAAKRHYGSKKAFDSEQVISLFQLTEEKGIDPELVQQDFDHWLEYMDSGEAPEMTPTDRG